MSTISYQVIVRRLADERSELFPGKHGVRTRRAVADAQNRIAHHEPIHRRDLRRDFDNLTELAGWICADTQTWITIQSRSDAVLRDRPH